MPKSFIATDIQIDVLQITFDPNGSISGYRVTYRYVNAQGKIIPELGYKEQTENLTTAELFSTVLGLADANLPGKAAGAIKVAKDIVKDHQSDFAEWVRARIRSKEGI